MKFCSAKKMLLGVAATLLSAPSFAAVVPPAVSVDSSVSVEQWRSSLWQDSSKYKGYVQIGTDFNFGFSGGPTASVFAADTADRFGSNWRGLQIPLETARNYEDRIEPFFTLSFRAGYKNFHFLLEAPLRKDLEAWYQSTTKTNLTYKPSELDINVPYNAYGLWNNPVGYVQFGRFKADWTTTPNDVTFGGIPYHDGVHWAFNPGIFRYDFMLSSLNAWLYGDVMEHSTGCPEKNTEAYAQKCTEPGQQVDNQRNRTYPENVKNLVYHRFGIEMSKFWAYVIETSMVGGKSLEFRSFNPFMFWHDNYGSGYTSAATSFEVGFKPIRGAKFYGQINMEDLNSPVGEDNDYATSRSIINYMVGYTQEIPTKKYGSFTTRFDVVLTDPASNNSKLPLLKYTGRKLYRSNYREQKDKDYADAYFVDYPVGYRRGPDALDLWLDVNWKYKTRSVDLSLAWLRQGDKELYCVGNGDYCSNYNDALNTNGSTSGVEETQYVFDVLYKEKFNSWFEYYVGGGFRIYENLDHVKGENGADGWVRAGIKLIFNPVDYRF
ncbi:MAG: hypothetical protein MJY85_02050 [Fibrobacter sp.]|nr:hypothetical protein [Fibrobacter sp.]